MKFLLVPFLLLLPVLQTIAADSTASTPLDPRYVPSVDWPGTFALRTGNYSLALEILTAQKNYLDTPFYNFKLGRAYAGIKNDSLALVSFKKCLAPVSAYAAASSEQCSDIELRRGNDSAALQFLCRSMDYPAPERYRRSLEKKAAAILRKYVPPADSALPYCSRLDRFYTPKSAMRSNCLFTAAAFDSLLVGRNLRALDSLTRLFLNTPPSTATPCSCISARNFVLDALPDSMLKGDLLWKLATRFIDGGAPARARLLFDNSTYRFRIRKVIGDSLYSATQFLLYNTLGDYEKARLTVRKMVFIEKLNIPPSMLFLAARICRKTNNSAEAQEWYDRLIKRFPTSTEGRSALWFRAWEEQDNGNFEAAIHRFDQLAELKPVDDHADESRLRIGLCYFKMKNYAAACSVFSRSAQLPQAQFMAAHLFWKGYTYALLGEPEKSLAALAAVRSYDPLGFYGFMSVHLKEYLGDTTAFKLSFCDSVPPDSVYAILNNLSNSSQIPTGSDSAFLATACALAATGLEGAAADFAAPADANYRGNARFQFEYSRIFGLCQNPALAYRFGRRLAWLVPGAMRATLPSQIASEMYPRPYAPIVNKNGQTRSVPSAFVWGIMRQESGFDHAILSRAGAVGLLQIMPYTGKKAPP